MRIGELDREITIQVPARVADTMGGFAVTWIDACTVFAGIWPLRGEEALSAMQTGGTLTHRIRIRYRKGIKTSWRVKFEGRYFNIISPPIDVNEDHRFMDLMCKEAA